MSTHIQLEQYSGRLDAAPEPATVAERVIDYLADQGVDTIFGIPGGHISPFLGALRRQARVRLVIARHEGGAAFMADGYARASGKPGVCLVTAGPGVTNALTGLAAAHLDGAPLLLISGQPPTDRQGSGAIQESGAGGIEIVRACAHFASESVEVVDPRSFARTFARVLAHLQRRPAGAVHLAVPSNVARARLAGSDVARWPRWASALRPRGRCEPALTAELLGRLRGARRPLLLLGSGAREAMGSLRGELRAWAEGEGIPVATTPRAKGIFAEDSPVSLGVCGLAGSPLAERYIRGGVDVLLVIGSRLGEWSWVGPSEGLLATHVTQVDVDPAAIGRRLAVDQAIVADAWGVLDGLVAGARAAAMDEGEARVRASRRQALALLRSQVRAPAASERAGEGAPLKPQQVMAALTEHLRGDVDLYVDMGNCTGWASHCLEIAPPARLFAPYGLSTMGWSCGAVVGGKRACPERRAIALVGDGAFMMNGAEISSAAHHRIGAVFVVLADDALGMVNHGEHRQTGHPLSDPFYRLGGPDLVAFARALGAGARSVATPAELRTALAEAMCAAERDERPQVVITAIDPTEPPPYGERFRAVAGEGGAGRDAKNADHADVLV